MTYQQIINQRPELKEEMEERAGIKEHSGNIPREKAEEQTAKLIQTRYIIYEQKELF